MTETTSRKEHLEWCKERALKYCDLGEVTQAAASFLSDMRKHPDTEDHAAIPLMFQMTLNGMLSTPTEMRKFILGFN